MFVFGCLQLLVLLFVCWRLVCLFYLVLRLECYVLLCYVLCLAGLAFCGCSDDCGGCYGYLFNCSFCIS